MTTSTLTCAQCRHYNPQSEIYGFCRKLPDLRDPGYWREISASNNPCPLIARVR